VWEFGAVLDVAEAAADSENDSTLLWLFVVEKDADAVTE
jgi:hypothetical protein